MPGRIAGLEADIAKLEAVIADPDLYRRDPRRFEAETVKLASVKDALGAAEDRWLELEAMREELENVP